MYRYRCDNCGYETLVLKDFNDDSKVYCEKCGSEMRRMIGRVSVIFKASGFYTTDARKTSKSEKSSERTTSGVSEGSKEKSEVKAES